MLATEAFCLTCYFSVLLSLPGKHITGYGESRAWPHCVCPQCCVLPRVGIWVGLELAILLLLSLLTLSGLIFPGTTDPGSGLSRVCCLLPLSPQDQGGRGSSVCFPYGDIVCPCPRATSLLSRIVPSLSPAGPSPGLQLSFSLAS